MSSAIQKRNYLGIILIAIFLIGILVTMILALSGYQGFTSHQELSGPASGIPIYYYNSKKGEIEIIQKLPPGTVCQSIEKVGLSLRVGGTIQPKIFELVECAGVRGYVYPEALKTKFSK